MSNNRPLVVIWRITEACGLACGFCAYDRTLARRRRSADVEEVLRFGRVLGEFSRRFHRPVHVSWLGGEPLQWPHLPDVSHSFRHEFGLGLGVTTNGVALASESTRRLLAECFDQVTVSIDGLGDVHDRLRNSPGLFAQLKHDVGRLKEASRGRLLLRVNTILMQDNIAAFPQFAAEMAAWGFDELTFNQLGGNDRPEFFPHHRLLPEQMTEFEDALPTIRRRLEHRGLRILGSSPYLDRIQATTSGVSIPVDDCAPGTRFFFIDERGRVAPCSFTVSEYGSPLARYDTAARLAGIAEDFRQLREHRRHPQCDDCHATHVCGKFDDPTNEALIPLGTGIAEGRA